MVKRYTLKEQDSALSDLIHRIDRGGRRPLGADETLLTLITAEDLELLKTARETVRVFQMEGADRWVAEQMAKRGRSRGKPASKGVSKA